jgi:D-threonine aldolase
MPIASWYSVSNVDEIASPALLVYPDRVEENIRRMIRVAGGVERLRPHMKTNKLAEVIRMHLQQGITRFKCATIAEAEIAAVCQAPDVLFAYQPVGPNIRRFIELVRTFPRTTFAALVDDAEVIEALSKAATEARVVLNVFLDVDCGMHRTGVAAGTAAAEVYRTIVNASGLNAAGLHAYDGHIHDTDLDERRRASDDAFDLVQALEKNLTGSGLSVPTIVMGGTPTFPFHAKRADVQCSPGTTVFWDFGYSTTLPDLDFLPAVLLLTRVISKPGTNLLCFDLGHKAVASEMPPPRVQMLGLPNAKAVGHSEEHLVLETPRAKEIPVGTPFYGMPWHICPTVALHSEAIVIRDARAEDRWQVVGRARRITI